MLSSFNLEVFGMKFVVLGGLFVVMIVIFLAIMGVKESSFWMDDSFRWGTRDTDK